MTKPTLAAAARPELWDNGICIFFFSHSSMPCQINMPRKVDINLNEDTVMIIGGLCIPKIRLLFLCHFYKNATQSKHIFGREKRTIDYNNSTGPTSEHGL